jgi:hypothetical protein
MATQRKDAGEAGSRPRVPERVRAATNNAAIPDGTAKRAVGAAPAFDPKSGKIGPGRPGMLANQWVRHWTKPRDDRFEAAGGETAAPGGKAHVSDAGRARKSEKKASKPAKKARKPIGRDR